MVEAAAVVLSVALAAAVAGLVVQRRRGARTSRQLAETEAVRDALMLRDRELTVHASHRLRTPTTAVRLILEDLGQWPDTTAAMRAELGHAIDEVARWDAAVDDVLGAARVRRLAAATDVDLSALSRAVVTRRGPLGHRPVTVRGGSPVHTVVDPAAVEEVLDLLLDHLLTVGQGPVQLEVADRGSHVQVRVGDDSPRALDPGVVSGAGPSLVAGAGTVATSLGGYLAVADRPRTRFVLTLPPCGRV